MNICSFFSEKDEWIVEALKLGLDNMKFFSRWTRFGRAPIHRKQQRQEGGENHAHIWGTVTAPCGTHKNKAGQ